MTTLGKNQLSVTSLLGLILINIVGITALAVLSTLGWFSIISVIIATLFLFIPSVICTLELSKLKGSEYGLTYWATSLLGPFWGTLCNDFHWLAMVIGVPSIAIYVVDTLYSIIPHVKITNYYVFSGTSIVIFLGLLLNLMGLKHTARFALVSVLLIFVLPILAATSLTAYLLLHGAIPATEVTLLPPEGLTATFPVIAIAFLMLSGIDAAPFFIKSISSKGYKRAIRLTIYIILALTLMGIISFLFLTDTLKTSAAFIVKQALQSNLMPCDLSTFILIATTLGQVGIIAVAQLMGTKIILSKKSLGANYGKHASTIILVIQAAFLVAFSSVLLTAQNMNLYYKDLITLMSIIGLLRYVIFFYVGHKFIYQQKKLPLLTKKLRLAYITLAIVVTLFLTAAASVYQILHATYLSGLIAVLLLLTVVMEYLVRRRSQVTRQA